MAFNKVGYGQVEPNHLSAMRTHQIYAQRPAKDGITILENGQFVVYDPVTQEVILPDGSTEPYLVFNEVKLYDGWRETYKDFALQTKDFTDGKIYPRLFKTNVGDIMTTNCVDPAGTYAVGNKLVPGSTGILEVGTGAMEWTVVALTTMPDGSDALKIQRTK